MSHLSKKTGPALRNVRVVDDHVVELDSSEFVLLCNPSEGVEEETVTKLHDVRLVDGSDALASVRLGVMERVASDTLGSIPCNKLDGLHNSVDNL